MDRQINFDMDGTLANLYGVENWLEYLMAEDITPYAVAVPLLNLSALARLLNRLQRQGWEICIISWLSKNGSEEYNQRVAKVKKAWLAKRLPSVKWDNISIVPYGTPKSTCGNGILWDDELDNRQEWIANGGIAYDVKNILEILKKLK